MPESWPQRLGINWSRSNWGISILKEERKKVGGWGGGGGPHVSLMHTRVEGTLLKVRIKWSPEMEEDRNGSLFLVLVHLLNLTRICICQSFLIYGAVDGLCQYCCPPCVCVMLKAKISNTLAYQTIRSKLLCSSPLKTITQMSVFLLTTHSILASLWVVLAQGLWTLGICNAEICPVFDQGLWKLSSPALYCFILYHVDILGLPASLIMKLKIEAVLGCLSVVC